MLIYCVVFSAEVQEGSSVKFYRDDLPRQRPLDWEEVVSHEHEDLWHPGPARHVANIEMLK